MKNTDYVTASELGEYVYCKRVWWLRLNDYLTGQTTQMIYGENKHNELSDKLSFFSLIKKIALIFILTGVLIMIWGVIYLLVKNP